MGTAVLQLKRITPEIINYNEALIFDTIDFTNNTIDYDINTGEITFNSIGIYTIRWFISPINVSTPTNINFVVEANGVVQVLSSSPVKHSNLHGDCIIKIVNEKTNIKLINISNANGSNVNVELNNNFPILANLLVIDNLGLWNTEVGQLPPPPIHLVGSQPIPPQVPTTN